jgi:hypothetical protein
MEDEGYHSMTAKPARNPDTNTQRPYTWPISMATILGPAALLDVLVEPPKPV